MKRSHDYYRSQRARTIQKKVDLLKRIGGNDYIYAWTGGMPGRLSKGKIHCSCPMCRTKSYDHLSHRDAKHMEAADQDVREWENSNVKN